MKLEKNIISHYLYPLKNFFTFIFFISIIVAHTAFSQNGNIISSRYGIGELNLLSTARQRAMGSVSIPLLSSYDISKVNPAAWSEIKNVRLQGGISLENISNTNNEGSSSLQSTAIQGLQFAVPVEHDYGITIATGFLPLSRSEFKIQTAGEEMNEKYHLEYDSEGGLSMLRIGLSFKPISSIHLGAAYNFNFGSMAQRWKITFDNGSYYGTSQSRSASYNGSTLTFGTIYSGIKNLTVGAALTTGTEIRSSRDIHISYSTHDSTLVGQSGTITLPLTYGFGASYLLGNNILLAADYRSQDWSDAKSFDEVQQEFTSTNKISAGIEFVPSYESGASFLEKIAYRLGAYHRTSYVKLNNQSSDELIFTAGFGFPIGSYTKGDLAFEIGTRGQASNLAGKDTIFRLTLSVNASELWFVRRSEEE